MVARNFLEVDPNIFYPRVDMAGELTGITGMEFPLLNYLIYLVSLVFGYDHWYGRLINLAVSSLGLLAFHRYLRDLFGKRFAFAASMLVLFSLFYYYSRKIMPDTFSLALVMIGVQQWQVHIQNNRWRPFIIGAVAILLGVLSKLPAVAMLAFLWPVFWSGAMRQKVQFALSLSAVAAISGWWYFLWVPHLQEQFGFEHFFMGRSISWTFRFLVEHWDETLYMFYQRAIGYSGFIFFLPGLYFLFRHSPVVRGIALLSVLLFSVFMLKSGDKFTDHEYYILPFIPFMAFVAAFAVARIPVKRLFAVVLLGYATEGVTRKWEDQFVKRGKELVQLDAVISPHVGRSDLVVVNSREYPTPLYFAHRKGWVASNEQLLQPEFMQRLKLNGCAYAIVLKQRFGSPVELPNPAVIDNEHLALYALE